MSVDSSCRGEGFFGQDALNRDQLALCRSLRCVERSGLELGGASLRTLAQVSEVLLLAIRDENDSESFYAFCRLNGERCESLVDRRARREALPFRRQPIVAEVLAETIDLAQVLRDRDLADIYRAVPATCDRVIDQTIDEILGFVPLAGQLAIDCHVAERFAEKIELPPQLGAACSQLDHSSERLVLVAQALLQLSQRDRELILGSCVSSSTRNHVGSSRSVAEMLSVHAARRRLDEELERSVRWLSSDGPPRGTSLARGETP